VTKTLPNHPNPDLVKGRIITLEFENYYLIGTYVVNAGVDLKVRIFDSVNLFLSMLTIIIRH
jgi:hypothetical protein